MNPNNPVHMIKELWRVGGGALHKLESCNDLLEVQLSFFVLSNQRSLQTISLFPGQLRIGELDGLPSGLRGI